MNNKSFGGVLALGNFDGVHLGHRAVFDAAIALAHQEKLPAHALTFDPHPKSFFGKDPDFALLMTEAEKKQRILDAGMDDVISIPFTAELASMTAEDFIDQILLKDYQADHVVVGFDFVFGKGREGTFDLLNEKLSAHGIKVIQVPAKCDVQGEVISSSRIREALNEGRVEDAHAMLGYPYTVIGIIEKGEQRGRTLKFPTANIKIEKTQHPHTGVYVVRAGPKDNPMRWGGIANFGVRPTFGKKSELFEFHLFDFKGDLYGATWAVELLSFIREEKTFSGSEELKAQIKKDVAQAKQFLKGERDA